MKKTNLKKAILLGLVCSNILAGSVRATDIVINGSSETTEGYSDQAYDGVSGRTQSRDLDSNVNSIKTADGGVANDVYGIYTSGSLGVTATSITNGISLLSTSGRAYAVSLNGTGTTSISGLGSITAEATGSNKDAFGIFANGGTNTVTFAGSDKSITASSTGKPAYGIAFGTTSTAATGTTTISGVQSITAETSSYQAYGILSRNGNTSTENATFSVTMADGGSISAYSANERNYGICFWYGTGKSEVLNVNKITAGVKDENINTYGANGIYVYGGTNTVTFAGDNTSIVAQSTSSAYGIAVLAGTLNVTGLSGITVSGGTASSKLHFSGGTLNLEDSAISANDGVTSVYADYTGVLNLKNSSLDGAVIIDASPMGTVLSISLDEGSTLAGDVTVNADYNGGSTLNVNVGSNSTWKVGTVTKNIYESGEYSYSGVVNATNTGGTINFTAKGVALDSLIGSDDAETYTFTLPTNAANGDTILTISGTGFAFTSNDIINVSGTLTTALQTGEVITLINSNDALTLPTNITCSIAGLSVELSQDGTDLLLTKKEILGVIPTALTGNTVVVNTPTTATNGGTVMDACNGDAWRHAYGGYSNSDTAEDVTDNTITINGTAQLTGNLYGGYSKSGNVTNNTINIEAGTIEGSVYGGKSDNEDATISGNTLNWSGGTIKGSEIKANTINITGTGATYLYTGDTSGTITADGAVTLGDGENAATFTVGQYSDDGDNTNDIASALTFASGLDAKANSTLDIKTGSGVTLQGTSNVAGTVNGDGSLENTGTLTGVSATINTSLLSSGTLNISNSTINVTDASTKNPTAESSYSHNNAISLSGSATLTNATIGETFDDNNTWNRVRGIYVTGNSNAVQFVTEADKTTTISFDRDKTLTDSQYGWGYGIVLGDGNDNASMTFSGAGDLNISGFQKGGGDANSPYGYSLYGILVNGGSNSLTFANAGKTTITEGAAYGVYGVENNGTTNFTDGTVLINTYVDGGVGFDYNIGLYNRGEGSNINVTDGVDELTIFTEGAGYYAAPASGDVSDGAAAIYNASYSGGKTTINAKKLNVLAVSGEDTNKEWTIGGTTVTGQTEYSESKASAVDEGYYSTTFGIKNEGADSIEISADTVTSIHTRDFHKNSVAVGAVAYIDSDDPTYIETNGSIKILGDTTIVAEGDTGTYALYATDGNSITIGSTGKTVSITGDVLANGTYNEVASSIIIAGSTNTITGDVEAADGGAVNLTNATIIGDVAETTTAGTPTVSDYGTVTFDKTTVVNGNVTLYHGITANDANDNFTFGVGGDDAVNISGGIATAAGSMVTINGNGTSSSSVAGAISNSGTLSISNIAVNGQLTLSGGTVTFAGDNTISSSSESDNAYGVKIESGTNSIAPAASGTDTLSISASSTTKAVYGIYSQATNTINFGGSGSSISVHGKYAYGIQLDDSEITTISNLGSIVAESTSGTARGVYLWNTTSENTISLVSFDETQGGSISAYSASEESYGIYFQSTTNVESKVLNVNTISAGVSSTQEVSTGSAYGIYAGWGTNTLTFTGEAKSITAKTTGGYAYGIRYNSLGTMSVTNLSSVVAETAATVEYIDAFGIAVFRDGGGETAATTLSVTMADGGSISAYSASGESYGIEVTNRAGTYKVENVNIISAGVSSSEAVTSGEAYGIYVQGGTNIVTFAGTDKLITAKSEGSDVYGVAAGCYYSFTGLLSVSNLNSIATVANNGSACGTFVYNRNSADSESATFSLSMSDGIISAYSANVDNCGIYFKNGSTGKSAVTNVNRIESGFKDASTITSGTAYGIYVGGGINTVTFAGTDSSITARTTSGTAYGIMVEGGDNQITGLKTINAESTSGTAYGTYINGMAFSLDDVDTIMATSTSGTAYGVSVVGGSFSGVESITATSTSGTSYGILVNGGSLSGVKTITATSTSGTAYGIYAEGGNTTITGTSVDDKMIVNGGVCVDGTPVTGEEIYTPKSDGLDVKQTTWKQDDGKYLVDDSNAVTLTNTAINGNVDVKAGTLNLTDSTLNGNLILAGGGTYSFQSVMSVYSDGSWIEIDKDIADTLKAYGYIDTEYPELITSDNVTCNRNANLTNVTVTGDVEVSDSATLNLNDVSINGQLTMASGTVTFAGSNTISASGSGAAYGVKATSGTNSIAPAAKGTDSLTISAYSEKKNNYGIMFDTDSTDKSDVLNVDKIKAGFKDDGTITDGMESIAYGIYAKDGVNKVTFAGSDKSITVKSSGHGSYGLYLQDGSNSIGDEDGTLTKIDAYSDSDVACGIFTEDGMNNVVFSGGSSSITVTFEDHSTESGIAIGVCLTDGTNDIIGLGGIKADINRGNAYGIYAMSGTNTVIFAENNSSIKVKSEGSDGIANVYGLNFSALDDEEIVGATGTTSISGLGSITAEMTGNNMDAYGIFAVNGNDSTTDATFSVAFDETNGGTISATATGGTAYGVYASGTGTTEVANLKGITVSGTERAKIRIENGNLNLQNSTIASTDDVTTLSAGGGTVNLLSNSTLAGVVMAEEDTTTAITVDSTSALNVTGITGEGTLSIANDGALTLDGVTLVGDVTGAGAATAGTTTIKGTVNAGDNSITQQTLSIAADAQLTAKAANLAAAISNAGTLILTDTTEATLGNNLTGTGTLQIGTEGTGAINAIVSNSNGKTIANNLEIKSGSIFSSDSSKLTGSIFNAGTFNMSGGLTKSIDGTSGTTILQSATVAATTAGVIISGTLNGNNKTIDMTGGEGDNQYTTLTVGTLAGITNLKIDLDMSNTTKVDKLSIGAAESGTVLNLSDINITKDYVVTGGGTITVPTYVANGITYVTGDGAASDNLTYKIDGKTKTEEGSSLKSSIASSKYVYTFTLGNAGQLNYSLTTTPDNIFKSFIKGKLVEVPQTLSVTEDMADATASMVLNTTYDTLNIYVNDGNKLGLETGNTVTLADGDTINLHGGTTTAGMVNTGWSLAEGGTLEVSGKTQLNGAITNFGTVNVSGQTSLNGAIANSGTLNVAAANLKADVTNTNGTVNLGSGELNHTISNGTVVLTADVNTINAYLQNNTLVDLNEHTLTITGGNLTSDIGSEAKNTGTLTIAGTTTANKKIYTAVNVGEAGKLTVTAGELLGSVTNNGTLISDIDNLKGSITNAGTFNMSGDLTKSIDGTSGTTILQSATVAATTDDVVISGTLDGNSKTINMQEGSGKTVAYTTLTVGKLAGTTNLKIDVDLSDTTNTKSDKITVNGTSTNAIVDLINVNVAKDITNPMASGTNAVTYVDGAGASSLTYKLNGNADKAAASLQSGSSTATNNYVYTFTMGDAGKLNYSVAAKDVTFTKFIEGTLEGKPATLSVTADMADGADQGTANSGAETQTNTALNINVNEWTLGTENNTFTTTVAANKTINLAGYTGSEENKVGTVYTSWSVADSGTLNISGKTQLNGAITNFGTVNVSGQTSLNGDIANSGTLNVTAANLKADVTNTNGTVNLGSGELNHTISNGTVVLTADVNTINAYLQNNTLVDLNEHTLTITGGNLTSDIGSSTKYKGTLTIVADTTVSSHVYTGVMVEKDENANGNLTVAATGTLSGVIISKGTLTNNGNINGSLENHGTGINNNKLACMDNKQGATFTNKGTISDVSDTGREQSSISNLGTFINDATIAGSVSNAKIATFTNNGTIGLAVVNEGTFINTGKISSIFYNNTYGVVTNTGTLVGAVTNQGTLTSDISKITANITNNGTFNMGGDLTKNVKGKGVTVLQSDIVAATTDGVVISGTLDGNSKTIDMQDSGTAAYTTLTVGKLTGTANLKIDVDLSGTTAQSDKITVSGTSTDAILNLTSINVRKDIEVNPTVLANDYEDVVTYVTGNTEGITFKLAGEAGKLEVGTATSDNYVYNFTLGSAGKLNYKVSATDVTFKKFIEGGLGEDVSTLSLNNDMKDGSGTMTKDLTINLNGKTLGTTTGNTVAIGTHTMNLDGGDTQGTVYTGWTTVEGGVLNTSGLLKLEGAVTGAGKLTNSGTLTINADNLGVATTNTNGTINLTGGELTKTITGGSLNVTAAVTTSADNLKAATINNTGSIALTGGSLTVALAGDLSNSGELTTAAGNLDADLTNTGIVKLTGGTLSEAITGGTVQVSGKVTAVTDNLVNTAVTAVSGGELTMTGETYNGSLTAATGGIINLTLADYSQATSYDTTSGGTINIKGGVIANKFVGGAEMDELNVNLTSGSKLTLTGNGAYNSLAQYIFSDGNTLAETKPETITVTATNKFNFVDGGVLEVTDYEYTYVYLQAIKEAVDDMGTNTKLTMKGTLKNVEQVGEATLTTEQAATIGQNVNLPQATVKVQAKGEENVANTLIGSVTSGKVEVEGVGEVRDKQAEGFNVNKLDLAADKDDPTKKVGVVITNDKAVVLGGSTDEAEGKKSNLISVGGDDTKSVNVVVGVSKDEQIEGTTSTKGTLGIGIEGSTNKNGYQLNGNLTVNKDSEVKVNADVQITGNMTLDDASLKGVEGTVTTVAGTLSIKNDSEIAGNVVVGDLDLDDSSMTVAEGSKVETKTLKAGSTKEKGKQSSIVGEVVVTDTLTVNESTLTNDSVTILVGNNEGKGVLSAGKIQLGSKKNRSKGVIFADPAWDPNGNNTIDKASNIATDTDELDGSYIAGQNSVIAYGTTDNKEAIKIFEAGTLTWGNDATKGEISAAMYIAKNIELVTIKYDEGVSYGGDITIDGRLTESPGAQSDYVANFAPNSLLMVDGTICLNNAAISGIKIVGYYESLDDVERRILTTGIADSAKLYIANAVKDKTYNILAGTWVTDNITMWNTDNIILSDILDVASVSIADGVYSVITKAKDKTPEYFAKTTAAETFDAMRKADSSTEAYKFMAAACEPSIDEATKIVMLNRNADLPEEVGVMHNHYNVTNITEDAVAKHLALDEHTQGKEIWAQGIHSKEHVNGLGLSTQGNNYSTQYNGTVVGVDIMNNSKTILGAAITYIDGKATAAGSHNEGKYYGATLYGRTKLGKDAGVQYDVSYIHSSNDMTLASGCSYGQITGDQDVNSFSVGARLEQEIKAGHNTSFVPHVGARWLRMKGDSFTNSLGNSYKSDTTNSLIVPLGLSFKASMHSEGWKMSFLADAGYQWNTGDREYRQHFGYNGVNNSFDVNFADSNGWYAGAGLEFNRKNLTAGVSYRYSKSDSTRQNKWNVNLSWSF